MGKPSGLRGPLLILAGALCFSTTGFIQALAPEGATPYVIGSLRMLLGGVFLLLWCAWRGLLPGRSGWPIKNLAWSALGLLTGQIFFFKGAQLAGVAVGTVVTMGFAPVATALLGWLFTGKKPVRAWYPATGLAVLGVILLNLTDAKSGGISFAGMALPLAGGVSYAFYLVFSRPLTLHHQPETAMMLIFLINGVCMSPLFLLYPTDWLLTPNGFLIALHLGLITSAVAFSLTLAGLRTTPAATASTLGLMEPLGAALLGFFALAEPLSAMSLAGLLCILGSAALLILFPYWKKGADSLSWR